MPFISDKKKVFIGEAFQPGGKGGAWFRSVGVFDPSAEVIHAFQQHGAKISEVNPHLWQFEFRGNSQSAVGINGLETLTKQILHMTGFEEHGEVFMDRLNEQETQELFGSWEVPDDYVIMTEPMDDHSGIEKLDFKPREQSTKPKPNNRELIYQPRSGGRRSMRNRKQKTSFDVKKPIKADSLLSEIFDQFNLDFSELLNELTIDIGPQLLEELKNGNYIAQNGLRINKFIDFIDSISKRDMDNEVSGIIKSIRNIDDDALKLVYYFQQNKPQSESESFINDAVTNFTFKSLYALYNQYEDISSKLNNETTKSTKSFDIGSKDDSGFNWFATGKKLYFYCPQNDQDYFVRDLTAKESKLGIAEPNIQDEQFFYKTVRKLARDEIFSIMKNNNPFTNGINPFRLDNFYNDLSKNKTSFARYYKKKEFVELITKLVRRTTPVKYIGRYAKADNTMDDHDPIGDNDGEALYEDDEEPEPTGFLYYDPGDSFIYDVIRSMIEAAQNGDYSQYDDDLDVLFEALEDKITWSGDINRQDDAVNYEQWVEAVSKVQDAINAAKEVKDEDKLETLETLQETIGEFELDFDIDRMQEWQKQQTTKSIKGNTPIDTLFELEDDVFNAYQQLSDEYDTIGMQEKTRNQFLQALKVLVQAAQGIQHENADMHQSYENALKQFEQIANQIVDDLNADSLPMFDDVRGLNKQLANAISQFRTTQDGLNKPYPEDNE